MILAGVLLKLGTYGLLRFGVFLFPKAAVDLAPLLLTLAVIGMIYGAIVATMQKDLKRLDRLLVGRPPRVHRARHSSPSRPRACPAACCRWSTTGCRPAPCSSSSG